MLSHVQACRSLIADKQCIQLLHWDHVAGCLNYECIGHGGQCFMVHQLKKTLRVPVQHLLLRLLELTVAICCDTVLILGHVVFPV